MIFSAQFPDFTLYLEGSGKIGDATLLMHKLYDYWFHKGYWGALSASGIDFLNALVSFIASFLFTLHFQWDFALHCATEIECSAYSLMGGLSFPYLFRRSFLGYFTGCVLLTTTCASAVYEGLNLVANISLLYEVEVMVRDAGIDSGFLTPYHRWRHNRHKAASKASGHEAVALCAGFQQTLSLTNWGSFLERMCNHLSTEKKLKRCDGGVRFDALLAMQILMQRENFLIALYDGGALEEGALRYLNPETIAFLISSALDPFGVLYSVDEGLWKVRERTTRYVVVNLFLFFFVTAFAVLKFLVKNAGQLKSNFQELSHRDWNDRAFWSFRLYNEAPYLHASRLAHGREVAGAMTERLAVSNSIRHLLRRVSSTCILVTMVLTFLNPSLFTGGRIGGLTLVWWLTIALLVFSAFGLPDPREREYVYRDDLERLISHVHHVDAEWLESDGSFYDHITSHFFKPRFFLAVDSLLRSLLAPFVLMYALKDGSVTSLLTFLHNRSATVDGVGSSAVDAVFAKETADFNAEEDDSAASLLPNTGVSSSPSSTHCTHEWASCRDRRRHEKVEKSIASFCAVYPEWMAERLRAVQGDRSESDQCLDDFVTALNHSVQEHLARAQPPWLRRSPMPSGAGKQEELFESVNQSWAPSFAARGLQREEEASNLSPRAGRGQGGFVRSSSLMDTRAGTAHEREHLFVSQVQSSILRSSAWDNRGPSDYGTESPYRAEKDLAGHRQR